MKSDIILERRLDEWNSTELPFLSVNRALTPVSLIPLPCCRMYVISHIAQGVSCCDGVELRSEERTGRVGQPPCCVWWADVS